MRHHLTDRIDKIQFWAAVFGLVAFPLIAIAQVSVREIAASAKSAMVTVHTHSNDEEIAFGSGFFIRDDGVLVTNLHVVKGGDSVSVEVSSGEIYDNVFVLTRDERRDLILLQIPYSDAPILEIVDDRDAKVGDRVYVIGNPLGLKETFSDGLVSAKRLEDGVAYLQISAPISEGSSGGPVLNDNGQVIGVSTLTIADGQNLNLAVPARYASDLLRLAGSPVAFQNIAEELQLTADATPGDRTSESAAFLELLSEEARAELDELPPYGRQVAVRVIAWSAIFEEAGWGGTDHSQYGAIEAGKIARLRVSLESGSYMALGVCDDDCMDIDLFVLDEDGDIVASDILEDAEPMAEFTVDERGTYFLGISLESCNTNECAYGLELFREE